MHHTARNWHQISTVMLSLSLAIVCSATARAQDKAEWKPVEEDWYIMELAGGTVGWNSRIVYSDGTHFRTDNDMNMKISRTGMVIEIAMSSSFTETKDGKPVRMSSKQNMSQQVVETEYTFFDDRVEQITRQGGRETKTKHALPTGEWLTPTALDRLSRTQRSGDAKELTYRMLDANNGVKPISVTTKRTGTGTFDLNGKTIDVTLWATETDMMPGIVSNEKVNAEGKMVFQETAMAGLGSMISRLSTKAEATGQQIGEIPELMVQTFITPDKPIDKSNKATQAQLRLTVKDGVMAALPQAGAQRVELAADGTSAVLTINIHENIQASASEVEDPAYLGSSAMIDISDELIQKLAKRAVAPKDGDEAITDPMQRAEAMRKFVRTHISKKGMATAFASASETAKMKTGDCSEHGVLLCALLRADGIPARVATGLVYVEDFADQEGIFGWHMWTQALIDGKWVDFDATTRERYNAAHVLTSTSSLDDGAFGADMASVVKLLGNLNIEVLDVKYE